MNVNNTLFDEDDNYKYTFLDSYRFCYNNDYYLKYKKIDFELKLKFGDSNEFHTKKNIPLRLLKLSEDGSVLLTIHDDNSLNYWSYLDMNKKSIKKLKVCPQCNSQIGSSKIFCSLCAKKICYNCKIVVSII